MGRDSAGLFNGIAGSVLAIDRSIGTELWRRRLKGTASFTTVLLEDGELFAGTGGGLYRLDPATGEVLWHNRLKGLDMGLVAFASGPSAAAAQRFSGWSSGTSARSTRRAACEGGSSARSGRPAMRVGAITLAIGLAVATPAMAGICPRTSRPPTSAP